MRLLAAKKQVGELGVVRLQLLGQGQYILPRQRQLRNRPERSLIGNHSRVPRCDGGLLLLLLTTP